MPDLTPLEAAEKLEWAAEHIFASDNMGLSDCEKAARLAASLLRSIAAGEYKRVVHAHWTRRTLVNGEYHFTCSHCQYGCSHGKSKTPIWDYCPNCDARMDGKNNGYSEVCSCGERRGESK